MYPEAKMLTHPRAYWFAQFSAERREERRRAALPQPVRYSAITPSISVTGAIPRGKLPPASMPYRSRLMEAQQGRCYLCSRQMAAPTEDHVHPKAKGGKNKANRLLSCSKCNNQKGSRLPYPCELIFLAAINLRVVYRARPLSREPSNEAWKKTEFAKAMSAAKRERLRKKAQQAQAELPAVQLRGSPP